MAPKKDFAAEFAGEIRENRIESREGLEKAKRKIIRRRGLKKIPANSEILEEASSDDEVFLRPILKKKPVRTLSGVAVVAVMAKPAPCPHGRCSYCPVGEGAPQSYTGKEPAAMRAIRCGFDPYLQVWSRLAQLQKVGHVIDKTELIVMGGTFSSQPLEYQRWFVKRCLEAMNSFGAESQSEAPLRCVQEANERAKVRNIGITYETRPDFAREEQIDEMLNLGVTRVELGVQSLSDEVLERVKRGHGVGAAVEATRNLRDSGLKVCYHMMPGLFSDFERDLKMFRTLFNDSRFRPDMIKLYPVLVMDGTELYETWQRGEFEPYTDEEAAGLIVEVKKMMPKWVRTMRIQRDIPSQLIDAGVKKSNLGELVYNRLEEEGASCRCIRCRDVGHLQYKKGVVVKEEEIELLEGSYTASGGEEVFISLEDVENDCLIAYLRLRFPSESAHRPELGPDTSLVRELRVLGPVVPLGERLTHAKQHSGFGALLLERAEELSSLHGKKEVLVNSGIGVRDYYRRFGYRRKGPYMCKSLGNY